jgi:hypothetical protein
MHEVVGLMATTVSTAAVWRVQQTQTAKACWKYHLHKWGQHVRFYSWSCECYTRSADSALDSASQSTFYGNDVGRGYTLPALLHLRAAFLTSPGNKS